MPFESPNYTQVPNDLFDVLMKDMTEAELKVVLAIARHTFGYHREEVKLSLQSICKMTGLSENAVIAGGNAAQKHGLIEKITTQPDRKTTTWRIATTSLNEVALPQPVRQTTSLNEGQVGLNKDKERKEKKDSPAAQKQAAERTPFVIAMEHLELTFSHARRCKLPDWEKNPAASNKRWRTPLKELWELCGKDTERADILIQEAVSHMVKDNLTFDAPDQILKVARSIAIDIDNGEHRATAPETVAQIATRMGAQYQAHQELRAKLGLKEGEPI